MTPTTLLTLPREVRFQIYESSLVSCSPIIVWSADLVLPGLTERFDKPLRLVRDRAAIASSVRDLSVGLLRCHSTIAAEAADIFYRKNTFAFHGHHDYLPVISWLDKIGMVNRGYLTRLEIDVRRPSKAWQLPDGTRLKGDLPADFAPRHPHLSICSSLYPEGEVDMVNPAFELIIHTLARSFYGAKITLYLDLGFGTIPGIELFLDQEIELFSMDLPNLIERWRTDYTSVGSSRTLEILYKAEADRALFLQKRALIEEQGWEIVGEEAAERLQFLGGTESIEFPTMRFLLKRKKITAPLMPAAPDPYSWKPKSYYVE
ncbi:MAG: hypothetical protein Q9208_000987 [Pyrenodesmia sp. 3 TL-2023]